MKNIILLLLFPLLFIIFSLFFSGPVLADHVYPYDKPCTLSQKTPDIGAACARCIAEKKAADIKAIVDDFGNPTCNDREVVSHMCNGGVSDANKAGCLAVKNGECADICKNGIANPPANSILCRDNSSCTVTNFNNNPEHPGMGFVYLDLNWSGWGGCSDSGILPSGESGCYWVATELCEQTNDPNPEAKKYHKDYPLIGSFPSRGGVKSTGIIWWIKPGYTYEYTLRETGYTCDNKLIACDPQIKKRSCKGKIWTTTQVKGVAQSSPSPSPSSSVSPLPTPSPSPVTSTVAFRVAESPADLNSAPWQDYTSEPMRVNFEFKDKNPGEKFVWVEFKDSTGRLERRSAKIRLAGAAPSFAGTSCALSFEGTTTIFNLRGDNFGSDKGVIKSGDTTLQIREWKSSSVKASWTNAPEGQALPISLTTADGQTIEGQCSAITQVALGAKVFCKAPASSDTDNVDLILIEATSGSRLAKQKVKIDRNGVIQGLNQKLEVGKSYILSLKAPKSLRRNISFELGEGTTNIPNLVLPVGDIFPTDGGDGRINASDKSELNRQWIISQSGSNRSADFNNDSRVNSIDYACMRVSMVEVAGNNQDDPEPVAVSPPPSPSPATSPSVSPSPAPAASPSPTPSSSPSPSPGLEARCPAPGTTATFNWPAVAGASKYYLKIDNVKDTLNCTRNPDDSCFIVANPPTTYSTTPGETYRWSFDALDSNNNVIQNIVGSSFTCATL